MSECTPSGHPANGTPKEVFASLEAMSAHLRRMMADAAARENRTFTNPTIGFEDGSVLPAGPGFKPVIVFRHD